MDPIKFKSQWGKEYNVVFTKDTYENNGRLYVGCWCKDEEEGEYVPYCDVTVNLRDRLPEGNYGFLDTNNGDPKLFDLMYKKKLIKATGLCGLSGFCSYPVVEFSEKFINMI